MPRGQSTADFGGGPILRDSSGSPRQREFAGQISFFEADVWILIPQQGLADLQVLPNVVRRIINHLRSCCLRSQRPQATVSRLDGRVDEDDIEELRVYLLWYLVGVSGHRCHLPTPISSSVCGSSGCCGAQPFVYVVSPSSYFQLPMTSPSVGYFSCVASSRTACSVCVLAFWTAYEDTCPSEELAVADFPEVSGQSFVVVIDKT